mmetsp:Transcript_2229/g.4522  ORF Transcript_2229/g.4522 Transcript_2229/m.4522 type:complete len:344 (-) Transcript_2229:3533-4564(-)
MNIKAELCRIQRLNVNLCRLLVLGYVRTHHPLLPVLFHQVIQRPPYHLVSGEATHLHDHHSRVFHVFLNHIRARLGNHYVDLIGAVSPCHVQLVHRGQLQHLLHDVVVCHQLHNGHAFAVGGGGSHCDLQRGVCGGGRDVLLLQHRAVVFVDGVGVGPGVGAGGRHGHGSRGSHAGGVGAEGLERHHRVLRGREAAEGVALLEHPLGDGEGGAHAIAHGVRHEAVAGEFDVRGHGASVGAPALNAGPVRLPGRRLPVGQPTLRDGNCIHQVERGGHVSAGGGVRVVGLVAGERERVGGDDGGKVARLLHVPLKVLHREVEGGCAGLPRVEKRHQHKRRQGHPG